MHQLVGVVLVALLCGACTSPTEPSKPYSMLVSGHVYECGRFSSDGVPLCVWRGAGGEFGIIEDDRFPTKNSVLSCDTDAELVVSGKVVLIDCRRT